MTNRTKEELEHELEVLKLEHSLIRTGLAKGMLTVLVMVIAFSTTLFAKQGFLSGDQYIALVAIVVAAILVYFAFVFNRQLKLKAKISEKAKEIEMNAGNKAH
jgi:hypothetical protein